MQEFSAYFDSVDVKAFKGFAKEPGFLGENLLSGNLPLDQAKIALVGLTETRNSYQPGMKSNLDNIRIALYQLASFNRIKIVDLGNLKAGKKIQDTYAALTFVSEHLLSKGIIPLFFGGTQDLTVPVVKALSGKPNPVEIVYIDSRFDINQEDDFHSRNFIKKLIEDFGDHTEHTILGYQSYFISAQQQRILSDKQIEALRLGAIRSSYNHVEPLLRDADLVSFDLSSIKSSDCEASSNPGPNGLYNEEACQLMTLAGLSDKLQAVCVFEYDSENDKKGLTAQLIAQLIWHFISGVSQRKNDWPAQSLENYKKIYVKLEKTDIDLVFYQNTSNNRYWIELPTDVKDTKRIISCSEKDYKDICQNEIPDRIWKNISKYLK